MISLKNKNIDYAFWGILLLGFLLRIFKINHGLPLLPHVDEKDILDWSVDIIQNRTLYNYYSPLFLYISSIIQGITLIFIKIFRQISSTVDLKEYYILNKDMFYLIGRMTSMAFGMMTFVVIKKISDFLFNKKITYMSLLIFAVLPGHILYCKYMLVDVFTTFCVSLFIYLLIKFDEKSNMKNAIYTSVALGCMMMAKYSTAPVSFVFFFIIIKYLLRRDVPVSIKYKVITIILVTTIITSIFLSPIPHIGFKEMYSKIVHTILGYSNIKNPYANDSNHFIRIITNIYNYFLSNPLKAPMGIFLSILAYFSICYNCIKYNPKKLFVISVPIIMLLFLGSFRYGNYYRHLLPTLPFLSISIAIFLYDTHSYFKSPKIRILSSIIFIAIILLTVNETIVWIYKQYHKNTSIEALEWMQKNIPENSRIALEFHNPPFLCNNPSKGYDNHYELLKNLPYYKRTYKSYRTYLGKYESQLNSNLCLPDTIKKYDIDYFILSKENKFYEVNSENIVIKKRLEFYNWIYKNSEMIKEFPPKKYQPGPTIKFYRFIF